MKLKSFQVTSHDKLENQFQGRFEFLSRVNSANDTTAPAHTIAHTVETPPDDRCRGREVSVRKIEKDLTSLGKKGPYGLLASALVLLVSGIVGIWYLVLVVSVAVIGTKKFGGEIKDWLPFWGQFSKIDSDPNIDEADKLQYLIHATLPSTRARELVESFPPSKENYHKAVDSLKSRFGQVDLLVEFYVRELLKLTISMNSRDQKVKTSYFVRSD
ncbi:chaperone protein ClpB 1 [Caerostris extrusa]|uniref:Chaperone protein ClpB 1 n=1 Tax=Caerostris extrusa TaxID=172846 RepID=A0AAV4VDF4_CAEEX|nr:chaperone protein ClpB 1 [Caerostris extrusa]